MLSAIRADDGAGVLGVVGPPMVKDFACRRLARRLQCRQRGSLDLALQVTDFAVDVTVGRQAIRGDIARHAGSIARRPQ